MSKKAITAQTILFAAFIVLFFLLNILIPDKGFSEQENRTLQTRPGFSLSSFFSGKFTSQYEDYVTDQFAFRDTWTAFKAKSELLSGKSSNNGIFLCENEVLIEGFAVPDMESVDFNLDAIDTLADNSSVPVYFALIPSASEIWRDMLPAGAPNASQKELIDYAYGRTKAKTVDMYSALYGHRSESIYYRTDHHWTTRGAYYGYEAVMKAMGMESTPLGNFSETVVTDVFYGTTYSSSGFSWVSPDSISTYVTQGDAVITNYPHGSPEPGVLYEESYLAVKDKYSYFYGGNTPLLEIETGTEGAPSLLIIRDSYMDSLSPYMFANFSFISIIDLRYYKTSLADYISSHDIDNVLVCYSVPNFVTDKNIFLAGR